jgi:hypothetical protein
VLCHSVKSLAQKFSFHDLRGFVPHPVDIPGLRSKLCPVQPWNVVDCLAYIYSRCAAIPNRDGAPRQGMQRPTLAENLVTVDLFALTRPSGAFLSCGLALCAAVNHSALLLIVIKATIVVVCGFNLLKGATEIFKMMPE